MSGKAMGAVFRLRLDPEGLTPALREMLLAMADHAREDGSDCWPGIGYLAHKCDVDRRTAQRRLRRLQELGYAQEKSPASQHRPTTYRLNLDGPKKSPYRRSDVHRGQGR